MAKNSTIIFGVTTGVEIEVENIVVGHSPMSVALLWNTTHDASCESDGIMHSSSGISISPNSPLSAIISTEFIRRGVIGGEYVSGIMDTSSGEHTFAVKQLVDFLRNNGETPESYRAGIHVHVSFSHPTLAMLKSIMKLWGYAEDIFYYIGGMGYTHRGVLNDFTYCHPVYEFPLVIPHYGEYVKLIDTDDLLDSDTISTFWERYGDVSQVGKSRYFPVRYHGINLSPVLSKGTVEFRVFNKSLTTLYIVAAINFCSAFVNLAVAGAMDKRRLSSSPFFSQVNSVYSNNSKSNVIERAKELGSLMIEYDFLNPKDLDTILTIISRTPEIKAEKEYVISHLRSIPAHWVKGETGYSPKKVNKNMCVTPNFTDIHTLRGER